MYLIIDLREKLKGALKEIDLVKTAVSPQYLEHLEKKEKEAIQKVINEVDKNL